jgi:sugar phosphate isomerase/epimerase
MCGVQMSTLKNRIPELGVYTTLARCAEIGYPCVEISQIPMTPDNVGDIKRASTEFGLSIAALSAALEPMVPGMKGETLTGDYAKIVDDCHNLECSTVRIGILPMNCMSDPELAMGFIARAEEMAARLKAEHDIDLFYHNHHIEFLRHNGEFLLDQFRMHTKQLGFELDIHWIHRGGVDPVAYIAQFAGRVRLLHLKDYRIGAVKMPEGPFDMASFMRSFTNIVEFAEIGDGSLPIKACIEAGITAGTEIFLVEQDETYGRDEFDCLQLSKSNIAALGYGDWFRSR